MDGTLEEILKVGNRVRIDLDSGETIVGVVNGYSAPVVSILRHVKYKTSEGSTKAVEAPGQTMVRHQAMTFVKKLAEDAWE